MAQVLIYSLVFAPDGVSTAQLYGELAADLVAAGHQVTVIAGRPHYNRDVAAEASQPLRRHWPTLLDRSDYHGIPVYHTLMPARRGGTPGRAAGWLGFHVVGLAAGLFAVPRPDVILVPSPLLTAGVVAWVIGLLRGAPYVYNVQELYPELAVRLGAVRSPLLLRVLRRLERFVYERAYAVTVISRGMQLLISAAGTPPGKIRLIPNFVDTGFLRPLPGPSRIRGERGWGDGFVVLYAGNVGRAQGLEVLLDAAPSLTAEARVRIVFVGDGVLRPVLEQRALELGLSNVAFVPHQPYASVPDIYAAGDACVVSLPDELGDLALPSKVLRIMACGRPVLALCHPDSDLGRVVSEAGAGVVVHPVEPAAIAEAVRRLARNPEEAKRMGVAGRAYVEAHFSRSTVTRQYARLMDEAVAAARV